MQTISRRWLIAVAIGGGCLQAVGQRLPADRGITALPDGFKVVSGASSFTVTAVAEGMLRLDVRPGGAHDARTVVMDPAYKPKAVAGLRLKQEGGSATIADAVLSATVRADDGGSVTVSDAHGELLLAAKDLFHHAADQGLMFAREDSDPVYGIKGITRDVDGTMTRTGDVEVSAGVQGDGGAPMFFTRKYAVLVDSTLGKFSVDGPVIEFAHGSRHEMEAFLMVGDPMRTQQEVAGLSGHAPMAPRWTMGFLNSQWGLDEKELRTIVARYRTEHEPLDGFIMDFDWKAWGEDNYGEWRWNSTSGAGAVAPDKFPDGAGGTLAADLLASGVHLSGILKPRIVLYKVGTHDLDEAATYAQAHGFWYPGEPEIIDYFSKRPSRDLNFNLPAVREWYWQHLQPAFDSGITGWWSDEADRTDLTDKTEFRFDNLQFLNMGRALYDGQRAHSDKRVWSINRNYFMGSQRYGYAVWSGDIQTGAASMQQQPVRMLSSMDIGEAHWSMDTGGFHGHPSNEVYARWMEFAAFVPIFRVHGDHNQKRQPWTYGPVAQAAAEKALKMRYELMPYIYANERGLHETGIGLVRPLSWMYPGDATASAQVNEWMFGDALLVAPVLAETATKQIYLPAGTWWDYASGKQWSGGQNISWTIDTTSWSDIPLFVRAGSIVATAPPGDDTDQMKPAEITLDIFPSSDPASFVYYEDDGATYAYEKFQYFRQQIRAVLHGGVVGVQLAQATGRLKPSAQTFRLRIHGFNAKRLLIGGKPVEQGTGSYVWSTATDKYGAVTELKVGTKTQAMSIELR